MQCEVQSALAVHEVVYYHDPRERENHDCRNCEKTVDESYHDAPRSIGSSSANHEPAPYSGRHEAH